LPKLLNNVECPIVLTGPTVRIHSAELSVSVSEVPRLTLAEDPLAAQIALQRLGLI
jgi:hypothetical protein